MSPTRPRSPIASCTSPTGGSAREAPVPGRRPVSSLRAAWIVARQGVRARRRRVLLTAVGIALASAMLSPRRSSSPTGSAPALTARHGRLPCRTSSFASTTSRRGPWRSGSPRSPMSPGTRSRLEVTNVGIDLDRRREFRGRRGRGGDRSRSSPRVRDRGRPQPAQHRLRAARRARLRARVGCPARRQDGRARARADARRRVRRGARQRRLPAREATLLRLASRARRPGSAPSATRRSTSPRSGCVTRSTSTKCSCRRGTRATGCAASRSRRPPGSGSCSTRPPGS